MIRPVGGQGCLEVPKLFHPGDQRVAQQDYTIFHGWGRLEHRFVVDVAVEFPVAREFFIFQVCFTARQFGYRSFRQPMTVDAYIVDSTLEDFLLSA